MKRTPPRRGRRMLAPGGAAPEQREEPRNPGKGIQKTLRSPVGTARTSAQRRRERCEARRPHRRCRHSSYQDRFGLERLELQPQQLSVEEPQRKTPLLRGQKWGFFFREATRVGRRRCRARPQGLRRSAPDPCHQPQQSPACRRRIHPLAWPPRPPACQPGCA